MHYETDKEIAKKQSYRETMTLELYIAALDVVNTLMSFDEELTTMQNDATPSIVKIDILEPVVAAVKPADEKSVQLLKPQGHYRSSLLTHP